MRDDVREAIEAARGDYVEPALGDLRRDMKLARRMSFPRAARFLLSALQNMPPDLTIAELIDDLGNSNNQDGYG